MEWHRTAAYSEARRILDSVVVSRPADSPNKVGVFDTDDDDDGGEHSFDEKGSFVSTQPSWAAISVPTSLTVFFLVSDRRLNVCPTAA